MSTPVLSLQALDDLQAQYIHALDSQDMDRWLALFSKDETASYICTTRENDKKDLPLALMLDDCYGRLQDRVTYITKVWAGTFQNYQTRHLTQRLSVTRAADDMVEMLSGFVVYYTADENGVPAILTTGVYQDAVKFEDGMPLFLKKRVVLDTLVLPRYIVYPI